MAPDGIDRETAHVIAEIQTKLLSQIRPEAILLFGSAARGDARLDSDLDLLVVWDERQDLPNIKRQILLRRLIGSINRPLDLLTCSSQELKDSLRKANPFTAEIVKEGVVLYGGLDEPSRLDN